MSDATDTYKYRTLSNGHTIMLDTLEQNTHVVHVVSCVGNHRLDVQWTKKFDTLTEAETEYNRHD